MKNTYVVGIAVVALVIGVLVGFGLWGQNAARLPQIESELNLVKAQMAGSKRKADELEANLGKVTNEKLNLEKEIAALKEALTKATKKRR